MTDVITQWQTKKGIAGGTNTNTTSTSTSTSSSASPWHVVFLWFLGALAIIALADPLPQITTWILVLIIAYLLLSDWSIYGAYLGLQ